jgi:hypothetical protein
MLWKMKILKNGEHLLLCPTSLAETTYFFREVPPFMTVLALKTPVFGTFSLCRPWGSLY